MKMTKSKIKKILPHRDPFLFIDNVIEIKNIKRIVHKKDLEGSQLFADYTTKKNHIIFKGHFPNNPIFPGVIQVEAMAQASLIIYHQIIRDKKLKVSLASIEKSKFYKPIQPDMKLDIKVSCDKIFGSFMKCSGKIYCNGELMSEGIATAYIF